MKGKSNVYVIVWIMLLQPVKQTHLLKKKKKMFIHLIVLGFYKNCLLDLTTHRSDIEYALHVIYSDHFEKIDLTSFLRAVCLHLSSNTFE